MWKLQKNPGESSRSSSLNSTFFCGPPHQRRSRRRPDPRSLSPANRVTVDSHMFSWGEDDESLHFWHLYLTLRPHPSHHRRHTLIPSCCQFPRSYKTPPTCPPTHDALLRRGTSPTRFTPRRSHVAGVSTRSLKWGRLSACPLLSHALRHRPHTLRRPCTVSSTLLTAPLSVASDVSRALYLIPTGAPPFPFLLFAAFAFPSPKRPLFRIFLPNTRPRPSVHLQ